MGDTRGRTVTTEIMRDTKGQEQGRMKRSGWTETGPGKWTLHCGCGASVDMPVTDDGKHVDITSAEGWELRPSDLIVRCPACVAAGTAPLEPQP